MTLIHWLWLLLRSDANGRITLWLCVPWPRWRWQFSLPWWDNRKYSKRWLGMGFSPPNWLQSTEITSNARGNFDNNPDILAGFVLDVRTGLIEMISFGCLFCLSAICGATLSNRFTRLEEIGPNVPFVSLKRTGIAAIIIYYFGCLGTAAIWNRSSLSVLHLSITGAMLLVTVLIPFESLSIYSCSWKGTRCFIFRWWQMRNISCVPAMPLLPVSPSSNSIVMMKTELLISPCSLDGLR